MKLCLLRFHRFVTFSFINFYFFWRFNFEKLWFITKLAILTWFNYFFNGFISFSINIPLSPAKFYFMVSTLRALNIRNKLFLLLVNILLRIVGSGRSSGKLVLLVHIWKYFKGGSHEVLEVVILLVTLDVELKADVNVVSSGFYCIIVYVILGWILHTHSHGGDWLALLKFPLGVSWPQI